MASTISLLRHLMLLFCILPGLASASESVTDQLPDTGAPIRVVTSFSILEDLVNELGGEFVSVVNLVGRNRDAHTYRPIPSDSIALANADLVVFNGLAFEGWMSRLIDNSGFEREILVASRGVDAIEHGDETDPHAWQSFRNIRLYISNISSKLIELRPHHAKALGERRNRYVTALDVLSRDLLQQVATIPEESRVIVTSHDAFGYLEREFKIRFLAPVGVSVEVEASAADVATVIDQIREQHVGAIFLENITNPRLLERISAETGVAIGGSLYSDALSEKDGPAATYLQMMQHNVGSIVEALSP